MGYTHYWYRPATLPQDRWAAFKASVASILTVNASGSAPVPVDLEPAAGEILFNGRGSAGYETFWLPRVLPAERRWSKNEAGLFFAFCKTGYAAYDPIVCAILLAAKAAFGDQIEVRSDGDWPAWGPGRALFTAATGTFPDEKWLSTEEN